MRFSIRRVVRTQTEKNKQFVDITQMPPNIPIKGHASHEPLNLIFEGIQDTITQIDHDTAMTLLTDFDNLPVGIRTFIDRLQPNSIAVFDKEGTLYIEISLNIYRNSVCFQTFLSFYHVLLAEFPELKRYISLVEATELWHIITDQSKKKIEPPIPFWLTKHFYVTLNVPDLLIEKLHHHFKPDEYTAQESFSFLLAHGFDKDALSTTFKVSRASLFNYQAKSKKSNDSPTVRQPKETAQQ